MIDNSKLVCTLPGEQIPAQLLEWSDLSAATLGVETLPNGVALVLPAHLGPSARDLAEREAACCSFLDFELRAAAEQVRLLITSETPGAGAAIAMLVGVAT